MKQARVTTIESNQTVSNESIGGYLMIGTDGHGEVVINLDHDRTGHIIFSPAQARELAAKLLSKATEAEQERL